MDYCPPIDINYGDYLRALITADADLVDNDDRNYRIAFINAFKKWGIYPENVSMLSEETLLYSYETESPEMETLNNSVAEFLKAFREELSYESDREKIFEKTTAFITGGTYQGKKITGFHEYLFGKTAMNQNNNKLYEQLTGLIFTKNYKNLNIHTSPTYKEGPSIEIHSIRLNNRVGPDNNLQNQVVINLMQQCGIKVRYSEDTDEYDIQTTEWEKINDNESGSFVFRGGCTLIFDLNSKKLIHVISKPIFDMEKYNRGAGTYLPNEKRVKMQYRCSWGDYADLTGFSLRKNNLEPIAHLHKSQTSNYG